MKQIKLFLGLVIGILILQMPFEAQAAPYRKAPNFTIVIDPGHGGENEGTVENGFVEKEMNLITAQSMYEELSSYEGVSVFLTRNDDKDLSMKERAQFAKDLDADFVISIHYNASVSHDLFGAEVWIPLENPYNKECYPLAYSFLKECREQNGQFIRGIKVKPGKNGDYYGIIRENVANNIPAVIFEHCHVDENTYDSVFCQEEEDWKRFGVLDATAIARFLGLKRGEDLDFGMESEDLPVKKAEEDITPPDICSLEIVKENPDTGEVVLQIQSTDYDSELLYYSYSIDGGQSFSERIEWQNSDALDGGSCDSFYFTVQVPSGQKAIFQARSYNLYDLVTESNFVKLDHVFTYGESEEEPVISEEVITKEPIALQEEVMTTQKEAELSKLVIFGMIVLILVINILMAAIITKFVSGRMNRR